ncbi:hypothetical protein HGRIS_000012 [Hohenbuehelia grisea]|uniref:Uncharacterized protein n=1 Tax=Hohenbuehelia grisea TaxID=104357 RepID=A0ABR3JQV1_9AGAR
MTVWLARRPLVEQPLHCVGALRLRLLRARAGSDAGQGRIDRDIPNSDAADVHNQASVDE